MQLNSFVEAILYELSAVDLCPFFRGTNVSLSEQWQADLKSDLEMLGRGQGGMAKEAAAILHRIRTICIESHQVVYTGFVMMSTNKTGIAMM